MSSTSDNSVTHVTKNVQKKTTKHCGKIIGHVLSFWVTEEFIPLACVECNNFLPFLGASSIPLCCVLFPATLLHQLFSHSPSPHLAICFLVYPWILLFPNSCIIPFWEFYFLPFSVHAQTNGIYLTLQKNDFFKYKNSHSGAVITWFCVLLTDSIFALILNYFYDIMVGLGQQCEHQLFLTSRFQLISTSMNGCLYYFKMAILLC